MNDLLAVLFVTATGAVVVALCSSGFTRREKKWVTATLFLHVGFACAQVPITLSFYGSSDMFLYFRYGEILAQMMERDPFHVIPEVTALLLHKPHRLPMMIIGSGTSTGSMSALAAWSFYLLGPSKYATCVAFAILSLLGKMAMYRAFRANVDSALQPMAAIATLFVPSFVFWSSGLIKEAVAVFGLGLALYGVHLWIREGRAGRGWAFIAAGTVPVLLIKPYVMFPFVLAGGAWYYWARSLRRGRVRVRPAHLAVAAIVGVGGILLLAQHFPEYSPDNFTLHTSELQKIGRGIRGGGSNFALGGEIPTTLGGQLAYAPLALLASLFRPVIFEARNLLMLANALETALLTLLLARIVFTRDLSRVRRQVMDDPFLVFCVVFLVALGVAVGLASTNLGTLSRYRAPILPFLALTLFALQKPHHLRSNLREIRSGSPSVVGVSR
jgi:4-amino-4-deoxy-L-arabinose transferase-like glycosyltransferase